MTEFRYGDQNWIRMFNDALRGISRLKASIKQNATALSSSHTFTEQQIKAWFDHNHMMLLDTRKQASGFMCTIRETSKAIAHMHAITMLNCIVLLFALFVAYAFLKIMTPWSVFEYLFVFSCVSIFNCFFFPNALVRNIPFQFQELCIEMSSASKMIADTFESYM